MDEMKVTSKFMTGLISKVLTKMLKRKLGCDITICLNEIKVSVVDGKTHAHLDADCDIPKEELLKLMKGDE